MSRSLPEVTFARCPRDDGDTFVVDPHARFDGRVFPRQVAFVATSNEKEVHVSAVGAGAAGEKGRGLFVTTRCSGVVSGARVMGATTQQGTPAQGHVGALIEHGPDDGVRA